MADVPGAPVASRSAIVITILFMLLPPVTGNIIRRPCSGLWRIDMHFAAVIDHTIACFFADFTSACNRFLWRKVTGADRRFAGAAGNIEHVFGLTQSGHPSPQSAHQ